MKQSVKLKKTSLKKVFLITMVVSLSISALIGIFVFLVGNFGDTELNILLTLLALGGYSLTSLASSALYERNKSNPLALSGVVISVVGFLYTVLGIWEIFEFNDSRSKFLIILIVLAASIAHASLLLLIKPCNRFVRGTLAATMVFIAIIVALLIVLVFRDFDVGDFYIRLLGVFAILDALGTFVTPILNKVYSMQR